MIPARILISLSLLSTLCGCALREPGPGTPAAASAQPMPAPPPASAPQPTPHNQPVSDSAVPAAASITPGTLPGLLHDVEEFAVLPAEEQRQSVTAAETRYHEQQSPAALIQYALRLVMSQPDRQTINEVASGLRAYLAQPDRNEDAQGLIPLAQVVLHDLEERERLLAQNTELQRKLDQLKAIEQKLRDRNGGEMPQPLP